MKKTGIYYFGGDYNPEQWDENTLREDMRLFREAHINLLTLPVFAWAKLEPQEGVYDFAWLDHILDIIADNGMHVNLATPTVAQPAWMSHRYPEVLPRDIAGRKRTHGMRVFFCYNSPKYRQRAAAIAEAMAKRYKDHPALAVWHVANEYGTYCYCDTCQQKFREWLKQRYQTIEELNKRWHTVFWGRTLYNFDEVYLPTELNDDYRFNPAVQLDYQRFVTESTANCFQNEYDAIRKWDKETPIQTNMSGHIKKLDQFKMAKHMDIVGWDNYPWPTDEPSFIAMKHDVMRGLKDGQSFMLAEQSPNQQNWQPYNRLKRPGEVRMLSYQAAAHGADTCLFFQMRQSIAGQEKFHGAIISRSGTDDTRIFREITQLGQELENLSGVLEARSQAQVGMLMDWNNWWALENASGPSKDINYLKTLHLYYRSFFERGIAVDILGYHRDLSAYKVIVLPMVYMVNPGLVSRLTEFVKNGGTLVGTVMTGVADENDRCVFGEYPGPLKEVFGLRVEETDALFPGDENIVRMTDGKEYPCTLLCDLLHVSTAEVLGCYQKDYYQGMPAVTCNRFGSGNAIYIGTQPSKELLSRIVEELPLAPVCQADTGVEVTLRSNDNGDFLFFLNHNREQAAAHPPENKCWMDVQTGEAVAGSITLAPWDVRVLISKQA